VLDQVRDYWEQIPCGSQNTSSTVGTAAYFAEIERERYKVEPEIFQFAQFTRHRGQKVLEVGIGAATDFMQWARAGAHVSGVDLTSAAIEHARRRLELEGLVADDLRVANCEALPYADGEFDLVYSWGVIHHTPDTARALREIVRVTRAGGECKVMIYNRGSLTARYQWVKWALLRGRPWKSIRWCLAHCVESPGTKAFTVREARRMLRGLPVRQLEVATIITHQDRLAGRGLIPSLAGGLLARLLGGADSGWYMTLKFRKASLPAWVTTEGERPLPDNLWTHDAAREAPNLVSN
jgi:SAM-dependent methyltransferase